MDGKVPIFWIDKLTVEEGSSGYVFMFADVFSFNESFYISLVHHDLTYGAFFESTGFTQTLFICPPGVAGAVKDGVVAEEDVGARGWMKMLKPGEWLLELDSWHCAASCINQDV